MAEDAQPLQPESVSASSAVAAPKPRWPLSRIILLVLLALTLGLWAFDFFAGNRSQKGAYDVLSAKLAPDEAVKAEAGQAPIGKKIELLSPDEVHKLLGRSPDATETDLTHLRQFMQDEDDPKAKKPHLDPPAMVEVYSFRGAFRSYVLRVAYAKSPVVKDGQAYIMTGLKQTKE